jgi:hypothetical protein
MKKNNYYPKKDSCVKKSFAHGFRGRTLFVLPLLIMLLSINLSAQNALELGNAMNSPNAIANQETVKSLVSDLHPTIYIEDGVLKSFGDGPAVCVNTDSKSFNKLYETNSLFSQVKLITVVVNSPNDINTSLNLGTLTGFTNLEYVLFLCSFDCDPAMINNMFTPELHNGITVFYLISNLK